MIRNASGVSKIAMETGGSQADERSLNPKIRIRLLQMCTFLNSKYIELSQR